MYSTVRAVSASKAEGHWLLHLYCDFCLNVTIAEYTHRLGPLCLFAILCVRFWREPLY